MSAGCSAVQLSVSAQAMVDGIMRRDAVSSCKSVLALDLEGVHDLKLHHPSSSVATSNQ